VQKCSAFPEITFITLTRRGEIYFMKKIPVWCITAHCKKKKLAYQYCLQDQTLHLCRHVIFMSTSTDL